MGSNFSRNAYTEIMLKPYYYVKECDEKNYGEGLLLRKKVQG